MGISRRVETAITVTVFSATVLLAGCPGRIPDSKPKPPTAADSAAARAVVLRFGERLQRVSLLAPDSLLRASLRSEYGELVTPALLETWLDRPTDSPGRLTSSPWPAEIQITDAIAAPHGGPPHIIYVGSIVERTSTTPPGGASRKVPVRVTVVRGPDGWRIAQLVHGARATERPQASPSRDASQDTSLLDEPSPEHASDVIREYYRAIAERRYQDAYHMWASNGRASGQTIDQFRRGFEGTASVEVDVAPPSRVEGAAGSRYVEVPVLVTTRRRDGTRESFGGTYTLRRSVVDGATPAQRAWRIASSKIRRTTPQGGSPF